MEKPLIKLVIFDVDDTLMYSDQDPLINELHKKFQPLDPKDELGTPMRVVDSPRKVQVLIKNLRRVLEHLKSLGITMTLGSMGPQWQIKRFLEAFQIAPYFDFEIAAYDRQDKGEKVQLIIEHYNSRLLATEEPATIADQKLYLQNDEVMFIDDNLGYLGAVDTLCPGVKVVWAHYRGEDGFLELYRDIEEQYNIKLN